MKYYILKFQGFNLYHIKFGFKFFGYWDMRSISPYFPLLLNLQWTRIALANRVGWNNAVSVPGLIFSRIASVCWTPEQPCKKSNYSSAILRWESPSRRPFERQCGEIGREGEREQEWVHLKQYVEGNLFS